MTKAAIPRLTAGLLVALCVATEAALQVRVEVPKYTLRGEMALLHCQYNLEDFKLFSLHWLKDEKELYQYVPHLSPPQYSYKLDGINVDLQLSDERRLALRSVDLQAAGVYRCVVSAERPDSSVIHIDHVEARMEVVSLPADGPHISGEQWLYQLGDEVSLNCTSGWSFPASELRWFINDKEVLGDDPRLEAQPVQQHEDGLLSSSLGLRFTVSSADVLSGSMKFRCVAEVAPTLWQADSEDDLQSVTPPPNSVREALFIVRATSNLDSGSAMVAALNLKSNYAVIAALMFYSVVAVGI